MFSLQQHGNMPLLLQRGHTRHYHQRVQTVQTHYHQHVQTVQTDHLPELGNKHTQRKATCWGHRSACAAWLQASYWYLQNCPATLVLPGNRLRWCGLATGYTCATWLLGTLVMLGDRLRLCGLATGIPPTVKLAPRLPTRFN